MIPINKNYLKLLLCLALLTFNTGCWDSHDLGELALVQALGMDLADDGQSLSVTTMIANPSQLGGSKGNTEGPGVLIVTMDGPSVYEIFNLINTTIDREVSLLQTQVLILGEDLAHDSLDKWLNDLSRFRELRRTLLVITCKGKAADVMKFQSQLEPNPAQHLIDLLQLSKRNGMFPITRLHEFLKRYEAQDTFGNYTPLIANYQFKNSEDIPDKEKAANIRLQGTAVYRNSKIVGQLDLYESQVLQIITNRFQEALLTIEDPLSKNQNLILRITSKGINRIKYTPGETPEFTANVNLNAYLVTLQSQSNYIYPNKEKYLEGLLSDLFTKRIEQVIHKTQQDYQADIFGFGLTIHNRMLTDEQWQNFNWPKKYPTARIKAKVNISISR